MGGYPADRVAGHCSDCAENQRIFDVAPCNIGSKVCPSILHAPLNPSNVVVHSFATLSCISSLAAAPSLPIWRLRPQEYYVQELTRHALMDEDNDQDRNILESEVYVNRHKKKIKAAQNRERLILSLALLVQVGRMSNIHHRFSLGFESSIDDLSNIAPPLTDCTTVTHLELTFEVWPIGLWTRSMTAIEVSTGSKLLDRCTSTDPELNVIACNSRRSSMHYDALPDCL